MWCYISQLNASAKKIPRHFRTKEQLLSQPSTETPYRCTQIFIVLGHSNAVLCVSYAVTTAEVKSNGKVVPVLN
jgi:hypothetical protein